MSVNWLDPATGADLWTARLDSMLHCWLASRAGTVAEKTLRTDQDLLRIIPQSYLRRDPHDFTPADVEGMLAHFRARGLSELSVLRHRASLSQFFHWMQRLGIITDTPVGALPDTRSITPRAARPFSAAELDSAWAEWAQHDERLANILLILARTGLRWSEARALTVRDFHVATARITVNKATSEGTATRQLAGGLVRRVPVVKPLRTMMHSVTRGREPEELLFTTDRGCQLHRTAVLRRLDWQHTGRGRRLNDLRHTAAKLWLEEGVAPSQVRAWMGHTLMASTRRAAASAPQDDLAG
ncbi:tyrosine-type recombinase/integrase [Propionibacterium sp.]|uniref:tyrosine-type recombinase/integrase n=1 Tax=Propionibacterium sp. TaxID=1977903 RepID=UPI0039E9C975